MRAVLMSVDLPRGKSVRREREAGPALHCARSAARCRTSTPVPNRLRCAAFPEPAMLRARFVCILPLSLLACITGQRPPRADVSCSGAVSCGREQLVQADQSLGHAIEQRGVAAAFSDVLLDDANLLREGQGLVSGKQRAIAAVAGLAPFTWTLARADVSADAQLGYSFGWMARGHYAAVWRRRSGDWKLAVFLQKTAEPQDTAPPAWFAPLRGERE